MASVILWPKHPEYKEQEKFDVLNGNVRYTRELLFHNEIIQPIIAKGNIFEGTKAKW